MKETRKINSVKVRAVCVNQDWYTAGDCESYDNMFSFIRTLRNVSTGDLEKVATDIKEHSDTEYDIADIMFVLANECCTSYFTIKE